MDKRKYSGLYSAKKRNLWHFFIMYAKSYLFINITSYNNKLKTVAYPPLKELKVGQKMTNYVIPIMVYTTYTKLLNIYESKIIFQPDGTV